MLVLGPLEVGLTNHILVFLSLVVYAVIQLQNLSLCLLVHIGYLLPILLLLR